MGKMELLGEGIEKEGKKSGKAEEEREQEVG